MTIPWKTLSLIAAIVVVTGCSAGATGIIKPGKDGEKSTGIIEYHSVQIESRLAITDLRQRKVGDILQVSVDLRNNWKWKLDFQYKFRFFDKNGFEVDPDGRAWTPIVITGNEVATVQAMAPNPSAETFRIVVRD